ncbi:transposase domain-containing protein, partial [Escherichia coli]|nr:transposase domain-containing protein [Escherichia coli]
GQFIWPAVRDGKVSITRSQLVMLLDKLDWRQPKTSRLNSLTIGTCRLNSIDPEAYLRHILSVLPEWPSNRVGELLPWNVVLTN